MLKRIGFHYMTKDLRKNYEIVQRELANTGVVAAVCKTNVPITRAVNGISSLEWGGRNDAKHVSFSLFNTTADFVKTNGLTLLTRKKISTLHALSDVHSCVINKAPLKNRACHSVGRTLKDEDHIWTIVGVVGIFIRVCPVMLPNPF